MNEKMIMGAAIVAVLGIGLVGLLNLDSYTGMSLLENSYCHCYGYMTDYEGNPTQTFTQDVRVTVQDISEAYCENVCGEHFHRFTIVHGIPVGPQMH